jgi:putative Holliday junction resolvase
MALRHSGAGGRVRALGIDVGEQRIGVAVSDQSGLIAAPHGVVRRSPRAAAEVAAIAAALGAEVIVIGLPLMMRGGGEGPQAAAVRAFAAEVAAQTNLPIEFYDERLTTVMAQRELIAQGRKPARRHAERERRREEVDARAAAIILQGWLDRRRIAAARAAEAAE